MQTQLYVHFPFCRSKCAYCALFSRTDADAAFRLRYAKAVARLMESLDFAPETIYFGGGTPSFSFAEAAAAPLAGCGAREFTVELNPADATPAEAARLLACGADRASMGVQSFDDSVLRAMGRAHTAAQAAAAFRTLKREGFANAGIDLIAGWPGQGAESWIDGVKRAIDLEPQHVSAYSLIREAGTRLDAALAESGAEPPAAEALDRVAAADALLSSAGYVRYEVSNWAKPGFECLHNMNVWRGADYLGAGAGAFSRMGARRWRAAPDAEAFVRAAESGAEPPRTEEETCGAEEDAVSREIFMLRTREGFDPRAAARRRPVLAGRVAEWEGVLANSERAGLLARRGGAFSPTPRGFEVVDSILAGLV